MHSSRIYLFFVLALAAAVLIPVTASAQTTQPSHLDLNLNVGSYHLESWARHSLSQFNPGLGVTYHFNRTWAVKGGESQNSYRRPTWYALAAYTPIHFGRPDGWHVNAGLVGGLATGYTHRENHFAPVVGGIDVSVVAPSDVRLNFLAVPNNGPHNSGFIGFQLALPLGAN